MKRGLQDMKAQLEKRLAELRAEYETGQKIFKDIEAKIVELEKRKNNLNETLLRISGAIELLEEVLGEDSKNEVTEVADTDSQDTESQNENVEVPVIVKLTSCRRCLKKSGSTWMPDRESCEGILHR